MASPIAGAAEPRKDAASASRATRRGEPRRKTSLTLREAPLPTILNPSSSLAHAAPVRIGEQRRKRRALPGRDEMTQRLEAGRLHAGAERSLPRRAAEGKRLVAQAVTLGEQQEGVGIDILDPDRRAPPRVGLMRKDKKERFFEKVDRRHFVALRLGRDHRAVKRSLAQAREQTVGQVLDKMKGRPRQRHDGVRQRDRQQVGGDGRDHAEPQGPGEWISRGPGRIGDAGRGGERRARLRQHRGRAVADPRAPALAFEQAKAELGFELEDLTAEGRLTSRCRPPPPGRNGRDRPPRPHIRGRADLRRLHRRQRLQ